MDQRIRLSRILPPCCFTRQIYFSTRKTSRRSDEILVPNYDSRYHTITCILNQTIRYSGIKQTEVELLIFFCQEFRRLSLPFYESKVLLNLYDRQLVNMTKALNTLDEDLQFDYQAELDEVSKPLPNK